MKRLVLVLVFVVAACLPAQATITYNGTSHIIELLGTNGGTTAGTVSMSGNDLILCAVSSGASAPTVTDSSSNGYTSAAQYNSNGQQYLNVFYSAAPTVTGSMSFTVSCTSCVPIVACAGFAGTNASPNDVHDGKGDVFVDDIQAPTGITPSASGALVVSALLYSRSQGAAYGVNSGITTLDQYEAGGSIYLQWGYVIQTSATFINPSWTHVFTGNINIATEVASFKAATGGGGPTCHGTLTTLGVSSCG